ncbi:MAG: hypothetical protein B7X28_03535 [Halothiobacillus sp. 13-55-253]|nr:MAG: hypothetical protein B7X28_03535 [Halothiobacillus sp. 13-55-253]
MVGRNGTGKSSLLALLEGKLTPDAGNVDRAGGQRLATVAQEMDDLDVSAVESVLAGDVEYDRISKAIAAAELAEDGMALATLYHDLEAIDGFTARSRAARLLDGLGFAPEAIDRPVRSFSGGWRMRINLARALLAPSDILLLDEPTTPTSPIWKTNRSRCTPAITADSSRCAPSARRKMLRFRRKLSENAPI